MNSPNPYRTGADLILWERVRQRVEKNYTPQHDDQWEDGQLVNSAIGILMSSHNPRYYMPNNQACDVDNILEKYEGSRIKQLAVAGALIAAEIDRLQRLGET